MQADCAVLMYCQCKSCIKMTVVFALQILENAAGVVGSRSDVDSQFDAAVSTGFNAVRIFGFGTEGGFSLQSSIVSRPFCACSSLHLCKHAVCHCNCCHTRAMQLHHLSDQSSTSQMQGQYNPAGWDAFDYVISAAKQRNLRLIVALADNW